MVSKIAQNIVFLPITISGRFRPIAPINFFRELLRLSIRFFPAY